jgi:DNA-binding transcriptional ArsR family regulator
MPNLFRKHLEKIASEKAPGPPPTFSVLHILRALELIAEKPTGRGKLAENLKVGEGAIRTIISRLRDAGLVAISKAGCTLTDKGLMLFKEYRSFFKKKIGIRKNELTIAKHSIAVLIKNCGHKVKSGVEQRDAAIMAGAKGATTILFKKGRLIIPAVSDDVAKDFPEAASQILTSMNPEEDDVIVVSSADSLEKAEYGALAAAWMLLDDC